MRRWHTINLNELKDDCVKLTGNLVIDQEYIDRTIQLQEITGELRVLKKFPSFMVRQLKVQKLYLNGYCADGPDSFNKITASELELDRVSNSELNFDMAPLKFAATKGRIRKITGVSGEKLKALEIDSSERSIVVFDEIAHLDRLVLSDDAHPNQILPKLKTAKFIALRDFDYGYIELGIETVDKLELSFTQSGRYKAKFPNLVTVNELIHVSGNGFQSFHVPNLKSGLLKLEARITALELRKDLTWEGEAFFNSDDFCQNYFLDFDRRGLTFDLGLECEYKCQRKEARSGKEAAWLGNCLEIGSLTIDHQSTEAIYLEKVQTIAGDLVLTNYQGTLSVPKLKEIKGNLVIKNSRSFPAPSLLEIHGDWAVQKPSSLEKDSFFSLQRAGNINLQDLTNNLRFNNLHSAVSFQLHNSSLNRVEGLRFISLNSFVVKNCPKLWKLEVPELTSVGKLEITHTALSNLNDVFHEPLAVVKDAVFRKFSYQHLQANIHSIGGQLILEDSPTLQTVQLEADYLNAPLVNSNNPKLQKVKLNSIAWLFKVNSMAPKGNQSISISNPQSLLPQQ